MNLSRCSELTLVFAVALLTATAGVAGAVSVTSESIPQESTATGETVTLEVALGELYADQSAWDLTATTGLEDAEWTVEDRSGGSVDDTREYSGSSIDAGRLNGSAENAPESVHVVVSGTVPTPQTFSYDDGQSFQALEIEGVTDNVVFTVDTWSLDHHTSDSRTARTRLEEVESSIEQAQSDGEDISAAETSFEEAVTAFDSGDFETATSRADEAASEVGSSDGGASSSTDSGSESGADATTDGNGTDGADGGGDGADGNDSDDGTDGDDGASAAGGANDGSGGIGFLTVLTYVLGLAVVVGVVGGAIYLNRQRESPGRDPLG